MADVPTLKYELDICEEIGSRFIAGIDEAGRGAIAGPVVAAAVILPITNSSRIKLLHEVKDSKQLSAVKRQRLYSLITKQAVAYGIGWASAEIIDRIGILPATKQAMRSAVSQLDPAATYLLIDGRIRLRTLSTPQQAIIRGDNASLSIAAASILAKVSRDQHMVQQHSHYPHYGFAQHKGYGTRQHLAALADYGPCSIHRHSFAPIRHKLL